MKRTLYFAFVKTVPVLFGYLFMGIAFGLLLQRAGYDYIWAFFMSLLVFAGSLQFLLVSCLAGGAGIFAVAVLTLTVNSRHLFYGLSFIERFRKMGKVYPYMIFSLTDETYSLLCGSKAPKGVNEDRAFFFIALLDHIYWITGSVLGALIGELIVFDTTGIDFVMTALFIVIFIEQWLSAKSHMPAVIGALSGVLCLLLLGPDGFILPALVITVAVLLLLRNTGKFAEVPQQ